MKILISGAGIAGTTMAYWLSQFGHEPVIVEHAPALRTGGYIIDFWGIGYDISEKMGLLPELEERGYHVNDVRWVDAQSRKQANVSPDIFRQLTKNRYISLERADLAAAIHGKLEKKVVTLFGDSISAIEQHDDHCHVKFEHADPENFDLVIGADGLHSNVRTLTFGAMAQFEKDLGLRIAAFDLDPYFPREDLDFVTHGDPGRSVSRFCAPGGPALILFAFRDRFARPTLPANDEERRAALRSVYEGMGWECPQILEAMSGAPEIYYDRVSQIHMDHWSKERVALIGDAAAAVSLLAGEGAGLGMTEAYVLAGEINRAGNDYPAAFRQYEKRLRSFVKRKQDAAPKVAASFVPETKFGIFFRNLVTRLIRGPRLAKIGLGDLTDDIILPDYENDHAVRP